MYGGGKGNLFVKAADGGDNIFRPGAGFRIFACSGKLGSDRFDVGAEIFFVLTECLALSKTGVWDVVFGEAVFPRIIEVVPNPGEFGFDEGSALSAVCL